MNKWSKRLVCETAFNGVMFCGYIIAVSFALEVVYGTKNAAGFLGLFSIVECCLMLLLYIVYFGLIIKFPEHFGEFVLAFRKKESLKEGQDNSGGVITAINWKWYNILMIEHLVVGAALIFLLSVEISPLVTIGVFLMLGIHVVIRRPYLKTMHNVRFAANMLVCIGIQAIYLVYKKASLKDQNKQSLWLVMPIIVCILLLLCVLYNVAVLIYELCLKLKQQEDQKNFKDYEDLMAF